MSSYRKTMREVREEMLQSLNENNLEKMRKAAGGAKQTLKMKDGSIGMDSFTASAIMQIYDKINDKNKNTFENMMKNGKKADIVKLMKFAMSKVNASYEEFGEEFALDEAEAGIKVHAGPDHDRKVKRIQSLAKQLGAKVTNVGKSTDGKMSTIHVKGSMKVVNDLMKLRTEEVELDEGFINIGGAKVKDDEKSILQHIKKTFPNVKKVRKDPQYGWIPVFEEVELDEAKYDLYHKDFSSAMQHSYKMAKKLYGITVDPKEIDDKVASGPRKPSEGKTNSYRLKGDKGAIQVQVYNKGGSKPFELNMYKEEVELDEAKQKPYVSSDRDGKHVMSASGEIAKSFKDMDSANAYLKKNYNKLMKEKLDKEDEPTVKTVVKMLTKASNAHAGQAKDLEKAVKEDSELDEASKFF